MEIQKQYNFNGMTYIPLERNLDERIPCEFRKSFITGGTIYSSDGNSLFGQVWRCDVNGTSLCASEVIDLPTDEIKFMQDPNGTNFVIINGNIFLCIAGSWYQDDDMIHYHIIRVTETYESKSNLVESYDGDFYCSGNFI